MTWLRSLDVLVQDARYAWRSILRAPGFTATVSLTFALGIGLNTAAFVVLDRLYLRPPAGVVAPDGLRRLWFESFAFASGERRMMDNQPYPMFRAIAEASGDPKSFAVVSTQSGRLGGTLKGFQTQMNFASANYFTLLGLRPALGRFYSEDEDRIGSGAPVVVLSHAYWRHHLGSDSTIIGKPIRLGTVDYTVVGVASRSFTGLDVAPNDVWLPLASTPQSPGLRPSLFEHPGMYTFKAFLRLPPDADLRAFEQRATLALRNAFRTLAPNSRDTATSVLAGSIIQARGPGKPGQEQVISTRLSGVAAIVLLITCANVVNLLLARAVRRRREIAVRLAIGISRARLVRLLTTETLLLALIAGVVAAFAGSLGGSLLRSLLFPDIVWTDAAMHWRVALFTVAVALLCGLFAGIIPALQFSRPQLTEALKEGAREGMIHRSRLRSGLLIAQAALSLVLIAGAGLFVRSLRNVQNLDIGYDSRQILFAAAAFEPGQRPEEPVLDAALSGLEEELRARPGIEAVSRVTMEPMAGMAFYGFFWGPGGIDSSSSLKTAFPTLSVVSPEFFVTAGIRLLSGSIFGRAAPGELVVNEEMAKLLWPGIDPLGQCVYFSKRDAPCHRVVGVVETVRRSSIIEKPAPQHYLPLGGSQIGGRTGSTLVIRIHAGEEAAARREVTALLRRTFPAAEPTIRAMSERLDPQYRPWRLGAILFTAVGLLALVVAIVGVYSTVAYTVSQRTQELGVRVAVGAQMSDILKLVVGEGLRVIAAGVVVGIALILLAGRLIAALLYEVKPGDPWIILLASVALLIAAALAALIPAWKGARTDPSVALRAG